MSVDSEGKLYVAVGIQRPGAEVGLAVLPIVVDVDSYVDLALRHVKDGPADLAIEFRGVEGAARILCV